MPKFFPNAASTHAYLRLSYDASARLYFDGPSQKLLKIKKIWSKQC